MSRADRVAGRLEDVDALLITEPANLRYVTGFTGSNGQVVVAADRSSVFLTDGRYDEQSSHEVPDVPRVAHTEGYPLPLVDACRTLGASRVGFERRGLIRDTK